MPEIINCLFCDSNKISTFRKNADIVKCLSCNVVYLRTRPTKAEMYTIYQSYAHETSHMRLPDTMEDAKKSGLNRKYFVDEVIGFVKNEKHIWLDIGCGWGALLNYTRELGFEPKGIELTISSVDFANMQLNIPVSNAQFSDSRITEQSCSVISMVHVLEHIPNPKETIQKIYKSLELGGIFCGIVPNIESFCSEKLKEKWVWLDPTHHYVHYSPVTLKQKLEEAGFIVEKMYTSVGDYDYNTFVECLQDEYSLTRYDDVLSKVKEMEINGKGEEIRFFARKL